MHDVKHFDTATRDPQGGVVDYHMPKMPSPVSVTPLFETSRLELTQNIQPRLSSQKLFCAFLCGPRGCQIQWQPNNLASIRTGQCAFGFKPRDRLCCSTFVSRSHIDLHGTISAQLSSKWSDGAYFGAVRYERTNRFESDATVPSCDENDFPGQVWDIMVGIVRVGFGGEEAHP